MKKWRDVNPSSYYPRPGQMGGKLIRELVTGLKTSLNQASSKESLPLPSHILIALSGGSDSIALALLLIKYGRRAGRRSKISALHINHGWRGEASDADERFVKSFCKTHQIPLKVVRLKTRPSQGESWEDAGRRARQGAFDAWVKKTEGWILTAHHADDLAETVLWRLLTGAGESHGGGIAWANGRQLRPLLRVKKLELQAFLKEEGQTWREDATNHEGRFLRSRLRGEIFPKLLEIFPRAVDRLVEAALSSQRAQVEAELPPKMDPHSLPFHGLGAAGLKLRRPHWKNFEALANTKVPGRWQVHLPDGWTLTLKKARKKAQKGLSLREEWVFKRDKPLE